MRKKGNDSVFNPKENWRNEKETGGGEKKQTLHMSDVITLG